MAGLGLRVDLPEIGAQQVADAHAVATYLVRIGRTDALARRADPRAALRGFVGRIEHPVRGQDQMGLLRDGQLPRQVVPAGCERLGLLAEQDGVDHHAVADDIGLSALKNAGRDRTQNIFLTAELQRVTGIGTALEPGHHLVTGRQHIHDLSLALVPPLQAEDYVYFFHCNR